MEFLSFEDIDLFDLLVNRKEPIDTRMKPLVSKILNTYSRRGNMLDSAFNVLNNFYFLSLNSAKQLAILINS